MGRVSAVLKIVVGLLLVLLVVIVATAVVFRYVLNDSLYWATEVPNFILVWMVFLGSVVAFHEKKHIAFDLLTASAPPHLRRTMGAISSVVVLIFVGALLYHGVLLVAATMDSPSEALKIPQGYLYLCLPISMALIGISALQEFYQHLAGTMVEDRR
jgi:TRAP-type C4-dicarboxylate transport system permease small subunit